MHCAKQPCPSCESPVETNTLCLALQEGGASDNHQDHDRAPGSPWKVGIERQDASSLLRLLIGCHLLLFEGICAFNSAGIWLYRALKRALHVS